MLLNRHKGWTMNVRGALANERLSSRRLIH